ncbi:hypothetical protein ACDY96_25950 [Rhizobium mongolense]|uniref:hypothetical protein n=1 Tax=Rhizobium mongolense TaxID=57676 RepID=UPI0035568F29
MTMKELELAADAGIAESLAKAGPGEAPRKPTEAFAANDHVLQLLLIKLAGCAERMGDELADLAVHVSGTELSFRAYRRRANATPEKAN